MQQLVKHTMHAQTTTQYTRSKQRTIAAQVQRITLASAQQYNPRKDVQFMQRSANSCITVNNYCKQCTQNDLCSVLSAVQQQL